MCLIKQPEVKLIYIFIETVVSILTALAVSQQCSEFSLNYVLICQASLGTLRMNLQFHEKLVLLYKAINCFRNVSRLCSCQHHQKHFSVFGI